MDNYICIGLVALCSSIVSGMTGVGGGILLLAFMTPLFPPHILIPLHGIIMMCSNISRVTLSYKSINLTILIPFTLGAFIGALAGAPLTLHLPKDTFRIILAAAILLLTWLPQFKNEKRFAGQFFVVGWLASFLSLFIGATGPLTAPFILRFKMSHEEFVATRTATNIPVHLFKLGAYTFAGFLLFDWWSILAVAIPMVFVGNWFGKRLLGKIPVEMFTIFIKCLISLLVLHMLFKAMHIL